MGLHRPVTRYGVGDRLKAPGKVSADQGVA